MQDIFKFLKSLKKEISNEIFIISDLKNLIFCEKLKESDIEDFLKNILDIFLDTNKTIILPSFISTTFKNKIIDLDRAKSISGVLSEKFRNFKGVERTLSPFFSYCSLGKRTSEFTKLNPLHEWGEGSSLEWIEKNNATCIILGSYAENNPLVHRVEYKERKLIRYRELLKYCNNVKYKGKKIEHIQYFLSKKRGFVQNNYKGFLTKYNNFNIRKYRHKEFLIYKYVARDFIDIFKKELLSNEYYRHGHRQKINNRKITVK